jgi:DNA-binding CsgD family transcriptional regulator/tetratricopeptide (TPR) repeat protein
MGASAALAGRHAALAAVGDALRAGGGVVLVTGDAGIGKTRLVAEALRQAAERGALCVTVGCLPLAAKLALLPVTDALRELSRLGEGRILQAALDRLPNSLRVELGRLLPELAGAAPDGGAPGGRRGRLFAAVGQLLLEVARQTELVLLVEDLQWADAASLDLLICLRQAARGSALSTVVTCRSDEAPLDDRVAQWLAHARAAMVTEVRLAALSRDEVAQQVVGLVGNAWPAALVDELYARAGGNPFLTEQLVAATLAAPHPDGPSLPRQLPGGLVELLVARAHRVGEQAQAVLAALAVAGRALTEPLLATVTGLDGPAVRAALRELSAAALLGPASRDGGCRPRHALLAEAVCTDLLPGELRWLHARIAEALEADGDPALSTEVAGHWAAAGRPADEFRASVIAARAAGRVFAFAEAATLWRRAIALGEQLPAAVATLGLGPGRLHLAAVDALEAAGRATEAAALVEEAYARFGAGPDPHTAALIHLRAAQYRTLADPAAARPLFEEALRLFEGTPPSAEHAEALRLYALMFRIEGRGQLAVGHLERSLRVAEAAQALAPQVRTLGEVAHVKFLRGEVGDGFADLGRGRLLAADIDDVEPEMWIATFESDALLKVGRLHEARRVALDGVERARGAGRGSTYNATILLGQAAQAMLELGHTGNAARLLDPVTGGTPRIDDWAPYVGRAEIDLRRGLIDEAARRLDAVRDLPLGGHVEFDREISQRVAEVALWRRAPEECLDVVRQVLARLEGTEQELFCGELLVLGLRGAADLAERSRARGDQPGRRRAEVAVERLTATLGRMAGRPLADHPFLARIPADRASWSAEHRRAAGASDASTWQAAAVQWQELRRPHRAAYAWWRCAEARLNERCRPADAAHPLHQAAQAARSMAPLHAATTALAGRARIPLPRTEVPRQAAPSPATPYALTHRERQVLHLLAHGRTNAQIGTELFISPKTAGVHVMNILRKLDVSNRAHAAAVAERAGLLDDLDQV